MSSILFYSTRNTQKLDREDFLRFFIHFVANYQQIAGGGLWVEKFQKKSHNAKKLKGEPLGFFNFHSVAKHQNKLKQEPFDQNNFRKKKSHNVE